MEVSDPSRARRALGFLSMLFFIEAGASALTAAVTQLVIRGSDVPVGVHLWFKAESLVWLVLTGVLAYGAYNLTQAMKPTEVTWVVLGSTGLLCLLELFFFAEVLVPSLFDLGPVPSAVSLATTLSMLALTGGLLLITGRLAGRMPFAAGIGAFAVLRSLSSVAMVLHLVGRAEWFYGVRTLLTIGISIAMGVLALQAKHAVTSGGNVLDAAVPQQPIMEASGMRLIFTGVALLVLGVGVTAISYSLASEGSGGGRYLIATGAIASGLVQVARGVVRLGKAS